jgi:rhamnulokinase
LAECYRQTLLEIESLTSCHYEAINIVGGGSNADWLNRLTAEVTGRTVLAGPGEATAIGNLGAQMLADGVFADLKAFRSCVFESFGVRTYP